MNKTFCSLQHFDLKQTIVICFKTELSELKNPLEARSKDNKGVKYTSVPFVYDDQEALIKMSRLFRSFMNVIL